MPLPRTFHPITYVLLSSLITCVLLGQKTLPGGDTSPAELNTNDVSKASGGLDWAVGDSGIVLRKREDGDGNSKWERVQVVCIDQEEWDFYGIFCADSQRVWMVGNRNCAPRVGLGIVLKTIDGGKSWCPLFPSPPGNGTSKPSFLDIRFENPHCGWIQTGEEYILVTTDCGSTWIWERRK